MKPRRDLLVICLVLGTWCATAEPAAAQAYRGYRPVYRGYRPMPVTPAHMPGWDWWRIYPYSPYNVGRNPYNPYIVPMPYPTPYPAPYPVYTTPPVMTTSGTTTAAEAANVLNEVSVSGPLSSPPPGTALIEVRVPQTLATVRFDGEDTSSLGIQRYYVTPELQPGKSYRYTVTASWTQGGQQRQVERSVRFMAGQTVRLDFTR